MKTVSTAKRIWGVCRWIWVAIILATLVGFFSNLLTSTLNNGLFFIAVFSWLLMHRIILVIAAIFSIISISSGIIAAIDILTTKEKPISSRDIQDISNQLKEVRRGIGIYNNNFSLIQQRIAQSLDTLNTTLQGDATAKQKRGDQIEAAIQSLAQHLHTIAIQVKADTQKQQQYINQQYQLLNDQVKKERQEREMMEKSIKTLTSQQNELRQLQEELRKEFASLQATQSASHNQSSQPKTSPALPENKDI